MQANTVTPCVRPLPGSCKSAPHTLRCRMVPGPLQRMLFACAQNRRAVWALILYRLVPVVILILRRLHCLSAQRSSRGRFWRFSRQTAKTSQKEVMHWPQHLHLFRPSSSSPAEHSSHFLLSPPSPIWSTKPRGLLGEPEQACWPGKPHQSTLPSRSALLRQRAASLIWSGRQGEPDEGA